MTASLLTLFVFGAFVRIWGSWRWWLSAPHVVRGLDHDNAPAPVAPGPGLDPRSTP